MGVPDLACSTAVDKGAGDHFWLLPETLPPNGPRAVGWIVAATDPANRHAMGLSGARYARLEAAQPEEAWLKSQTSCSSTMR